MFNAMLNLNKTHNNDYISLFYTPFHSACGLYNSLLRWCGGGLVP